MRHLLVLPLIATLVACGGGSHSSPRQGSAAPIAPATLEEKLQGVWERRGYGKALNITGTTIESFDFTSATCLLVESESVDDFDGLVLNDEESVFTTQVTALSFTERYSRREALPQICDGLLEDSPQAIYEHTWHSFNEYYAFFQEREVDWLAQRDATRDQVSNGISDLQLFTVLSTLLTPLDDEHVHLTAADRSFNPAQPKGFLQDLLAEFEQQSDIPDLVDYISAQLARWDLNIHQQYLDGDASAAADGVFTWGTIGDGIGYLRINAMILTFDEALEDQVETVEPLLDQIFTDLADTSAMIVDIRLNGGGADPIALAIARRFADAERLAVSKFTRTLSGEGPLESIYLSPTERPSYLNPVTLITSGFSTSAAEVFTLAMRGWPQVTHIGEATNGAMSDVLEKPLPNGWVVELSNEVYLDANGESYEVTGIPPHIEVEVFGQEEREVGRDSAIDAALELLGFDF